MQCEGQPYVTIAQSLLWVDAVEKDFEGAAEQYRFETSIGRARSIQEVGAHESIVAHQWQAADFFNSIGHQLK